MGSANDLEVAVSSLGAVTQICFRARAASPGQLSDLSRGPAFEELFDRQRHREISIAQPRGESAALALATPKVGSAFCDFQRA